MNLSWNGDLVNVNFRNKIEIAVWGDYVVEKICAIKDGAFELVLAAEPVKKGATA